MPTPTTITRALTQLHAQWLNFTSDEEARLLRWQVKPDEFPLVEAFIKSEMDAETAQTADLFIHLKSTFTESYGLALRDELIEQYNAANQLQDKKGGAQWQPPPLDPPSTTPRKGISEFLETLESFRKTHINDDNVILGVWLDPPNLKSEDGLIDWFKLLIKVAPDSCRLIVLEPTANPWLADLAKSNPKQIMTTQANLDISGLAEEVSESAGDLNTPAGQFRHLMVQAGRASESGDSVRAIALAQGAIKIASDQQWHLLMAVPQIFMGGIYTIQAKLNEAHHCYLIAEQSALKSQESNEPSANKIQLQARLMQGSTLIAKGDFESAAKLYQETVPIAQSAEDLRSTLDCWRLACYCLEQLNQITYAWDMGQHGLNVVMKMDEETRKTSIALYLAENMMRLCEHPALIQHKYETKKRIANLLGPNWRHNSAKPAA